MKKFNLRIFFHSLFSGYSYKQELEVDKEIEKFAPIMYLRKIDGEIIDLTRERKKILDENKLTLKDIR